MLEPTDDGSVERPASSAREGTTPAAVKPVVEDRMVYKLVKVGDDGSVLAATEDEVFQSLVSGSGSGLSSFDPEGSDANEDEDDDEGSDYVDSAEDESDGKDDVLPLQDLAAERQKLRARLEVLDTMLLRVGGEEQQRFPTGGESAGNVLGHESNSSPYYTAGDGSGDKRQRRPNPKYFELEAGTDPALGPQALNSSSGEPATALMLPERTPTRATIISPRVSSGWGSHRSSVRSASAHRARTAVTQKPFTRTAKFDKPGLVVPGVGTVSNHEMSLDNLSIRELHEAFRSTYGRETSVKDKHWLKRQISAGMRNAVLKSSSQLPAHSNLKARLDQQVSAEQPLPSESAPNVGVTERDTTNEAQVHGSNGGALLASYGPESKRSYRRVTAPVVVSSGGGFDVIPGSLNGLGAAGGQIAIYGEVVNTDDQTTGEPVGGKRQRKPNRRYFEDEGDVAGGGTPVNRLASGDSEGEEMSTRLSWRTVEADGPADMIGRHGTLRGPVLRNSSRPNLSIVQRSKPINNVMKRKVDGRAAKLVKMAHTTARAARQDTDGTVRKVKFRLPAALGMEKDGLTELNGGAGDQVSCLLPVLPVDSSINPQILPLDSRAPEGEQPVATVPTANGGTRRKHHRPWTLREVMTLVEGVARCGGGKWADIKKLAFAAVGYRTAVDLKDKWRNLLRASRAQLHPPKQGERKKQFTAAIPAPILARVRELAALQNQIPPIAASGGSTSRSGRTVHRK